MSFRLWLAQRLADQDADGNIRPPGGVAGIALEEPDGATTALLSRGDAFDMYRGTRELLVFSIIPGNALRLAWFILWTWWFRATWCGLKLRLWTWCLAPGVPSPPVPKAKPHPVRTALGTGYGPDKVQVHHG